MTISETRQKRLLVLFDLPTTGKAERNTAAGFRKALISTGFSMMQYSVYSRFCNSDEIVETHIARLRRYVPSKGSVRILVITENQFQKMEVLVGEATKNEKRAGEQFSLF